MSLEYIICNWPTLLMKIILKSGKLMSEIGSTGQFWNLKLPATIAAQPRR